MCTEFGNRTSKVEREALVVNPIYNMISLVIRLAEEEDLVKMNAVCIHSGWMIRDKVISESYL